MENLPIQYPELSQAIRTSFFEDFAEDLNDFGIFEIDRISEISSTSYDGFIPFTNGGFDCMVLQTLDNAYGSGMMGTNEATIIQPYIDQSLKDAAQWFMESREDCKDLLATFEAGEQSADSVLFDYFDNEEDLHNYHPDLFVKPAFYETVAGTLREDFYQYESECVREGGEYWLQCRAIFYAPDNSRNITGKPEIFFFSGINTDFTYGRDKGLVCTFERTYSIDRLTPARVRVIVAAMRESL